VKATTGEGMGFVGRREGVAAMAVATLVVWGLLRRAGAVAPAALSARARRQTRRSQGHDRRAGTGQVPDAAL